MLDKSITQIAKELAEQNNKPYKMILGSLITYLAIVITHNRVRFHYEEDRDPVIVNFYFMGYIGTGVGKDNSITLVKNACFNSCLDKIKIDLKNQREFRISEVKRMAEKEYPNYNKKDKEDKTMWDFKGRRQYIEDNYPRSVNYIADDATPESIRSNRWELDQNDKGSLTFKNTEFLSYLEASIRDNSKLITFFGELWDGDDEGKSTKGDTENKSGAKQIPQNLIVFSSPDSMHETNSFRQLKELLKTKFARRCYFFYSPDYKEKIQSVSERKAKRHSTRNKSTRINYQDYFLGILEKTKPVLASKAEGGYFSPKKIVTTKDKKTGITQYGYEKSALAYKDYTIKFDSEVENIYEEFVNEIKKEAENIKDVALKAEINNRGWPVLKLAVLLHCVYNPEDQFISEKALLEAIEMYKGSAADYKNFINAKPHSNAKKIFEYMVSKLNKEVTLAEIKENFSFYNKNSFHKNIVEDLEVVEHYFCGPNSEYSFNAVLPPKGKPAMKIYSVCKKIEKLGGK